MNNTWNRIVYAFWSPIYDWLIKIPLYEKGRRQAWNVAAPQSNDDVLLIGIGTGVDFKYLPAGIQVTGIDLSDSMLNLSRKKAEKLGLEVQLLTGNAEQLPLPDQQFDLVALYLILSVVSDPVKCFQEAVRVTKPDGRIIIFDKFLAHDQKASFARRLLNLLTSFFGTDVNRKFEDMISETDITIEVDQPLSTGSTFRIILLKPNRS